jgi:hypothetical protein
MGSSTTTTVHHRAAISFSFFYFYDAFLNFPFALRSKCGRADERHTLKKKTAFDVIRRDSFPSAANEFPAFARSLTSPL